MNNNKMCRQYDRAKVLETIKHNRADHESEYKKAMLEYNRLLICNLESKLNDAKNGKAVSHSINIKRPTQYLKHYDMAIKMFSMQIDDVVALNDDEFKRYIMNEWAWSNDFHTNTTSYNINTGT